jgi:hypothetical protein
MGRVAVTGQVVSYDSVTGGLEAPGATAGSGVGDMFQQVAEPLPSTV